MMSRVISIFIYIEHNHLNIQHAGIGVVKFYHRLDKTVVHFIYTGTLHRL